MHLPLGLSLDVRAKKRCHALVRIQLSLALLLSLVSAPLAVSAITIPAAAITTTDPATVTVNCTTAAITGTTPASVTDQEFPASSGEWRQTIWVEIQASVGDVLTITAQDCTFAGNPWELTVTPSMGTGGVAIDITGQTPTYQFTVDPNFEHKPFQFEGLFNPKPAFNGGVLERRAFAVEFVARTNPPAPPADDTAEPLPSAASPWHLQQVPMPKSGTCDDMSDSELSWGTGVTGGWTQSWAQWVNDGSGGIVCTRTMEWSPGNSWRLAS
jgi:hypothetical protein